MVIKCTKAEEEFILEQMCCNELKKGITTETHNVNCRLVGCERCYKKFGIIFEETDNEDNSIR